MDESGFNLHLRRSRGRSKKGTKAFIIQPSSKGPNITVIAAFSPVTGIVHYSHHTGSTCAEDYDRFISDMLRESRFQVRSHFIIHDNASIHLKASLESLLEGQRLTHEMKFLPPYSPQLNPIETMWSIWKSAVKREQMSVRNTEARLTALINHTATCISPDNAKTIYHHVNRHYVHCAASLPLDEKYNPYLIV